MPAGEKSGYVSIAQEDKAVLDKILGGETHGYSERSMAILEVLPNPATERKRYVDMLAYCLENTDREEFPRTGRPIQVKVPIQLDTERLRTRLAAKVDGDLQYAIVDRPSATVLAERLFDNLLSKLSERSEQVFALGWILADRVIPYVQIPPGGVRMNEAEFRTTLERVKPQLGMIRAIHHWPFEQKTERAALMLGAIMVGATEEERAVLMASALTLAEKKGEAGILSKLDKVRP